MDVDRELGPLQAEHEDASDRLGADPLEPRQLGLDGFVLQLPDQQHFCSVAGVKRLTAFQTVPQASSVMLPLCCRMRTPVCLNLLSMTQAGAPSCIATHVHW